MKTISLLTTLFYVVMTLGMIIEPSYTPSRTFIIISLATLVVYQLKENV